MRPAMVTALAVVCFGCGGNGDGDAADLAAPADLSAALPDLALPPPADLAFGIGWGDGGVAACGPTGGTAHAQWVWNQLLVPTKSTQYAFDLNGDGRADNQLGNIEGALGSNGGNPQTEATDAVQSGQSLTLVDERAHDLAGDACAAVNLSSARPMSSPDFSGAGHFTPDGTQVGHFFGPIAASQFTSQPPPAVAQVPVVVTMRLPLMGVVTSIDVVGARVTYLRTLDGKIASGQLNGAIRKHDVDTKLVPNLAASLTAKVQADPSSSTSQQLLSLFDNGGKADPACSAGTCKNLDGSCAVAHDGIISDCEVASSSIIANVLAPDVQLFDAAGNYHPNPANTNKDCLSLGYGFTAVPATF